MFDESVRLFKKTLELRKSKLGLDHPDTLWTMANLGVSYRNVGKQAEAVALLEEALERARKLPGPMPARLEWVVGALAAASDRGGQFARLGRSLLKQCKWDEAESIFRQCLAAIGGTVDSTSRPGVAAHSGFRMVIRAVSELLARVGERGASAP